MKKGVEGKMQPLCPSTSLKSDPRLRNPRVFFQHYSILLTFPYKFFPSPFIIPPPKLTLFYFIFIFFTQQLCNALHCKSLVSITIYSLRLLFRQVRGKRLGDLFFNGLRPFIFLKTYTSLIFFNFVLNILF